VEQQEHLRKLHVKQKCEQVLSIVSIVGRKRAFDLLVQICCSTWNGERQNYGFDKELVVEECFTWKLSTPDDYLIGAAAVRVFWVVPRGTFECFQLSR
jgi:hypothetical protein